MSSADKREALARLCFALNGNGAECSVRVQDIAEYLGIKYTEKMKALDESADTFRDNLNSSDWAYSSVCWFDESMVELLDPEWSTSWDVSY